LSLQLVSPRCSEFTFISRIFCRAALRSGRRPAVVTGNRAGSVATCGARASVNAHIEAQTPPVRGARRAAWLTGRA
jgi:hypothetical protein